MHQAGLKGCPKRRFIGWSMNRRINRHLVLNALSMALGRRQIESNLIHHSDRGVQYLSDDFQALLKANGITCSMSYKASCYEREACPRGAMPWSKASSQHSNGNA